MFFRSFTITISTRYCFKLGREKVKYHEVAHAIFLKRVNRFIAEVQINGTTEQVHVKNTGRLKELLIEGAEVVLEPSRNPNRKTKYSLIAVKANDRWVNIDSQAPNPVAFEALEDGKVAELGQLSLLKREVRYGDSRFDIAFLRGEQEGFIEVKGVTLAKNGIAMFPDAPTTRGTKHLKELVRAVQDGYVGAVLFVIQMEGCQGFTPNFEMDMTFSDALLEASKKGVQILAYDSIVNEDKMILHKSLPVYLMGLEGEYGLS